MDFLRTAPQWLSRSHSLEWIRQSSTLSGSSGGICPILGLIKEATKEVWHKMQLHVSFDQHIAPNKSKRDEIYQQWSFL